MTTRRADYAYDVPRPVAFGGAWWLLVDAEVRGPWTTYEEADAARDALWARWAARARKLRGWLWRSTATRWVLTVPADVPVRGRLLEHLPCATPTRTG